MLHSRVWKKRVMLGLLQSVRQGVCPMTARRSVGEETFSERCDVVTGFSGFDVFVLFIYFIARPMVADETSVIQVLSDPCAQPHGPQEAPRCPAGDAIMLRY